MGSPDYFWNQGRKETDLKYNDSEIEWRISRLTQNRLKIQIQSRYLSDPYISDIEFNNKTAWAEKTLKPESNKIYFVLVPLRRASYLVPLH